MPGSTPSKPRGDLPKLRRRTATAVRVLDDLFGVEEWDGPRDPLDVLIKTILSQNTNDDNRDRAYGGLRKKFPTWESVMNAHVKTIAGAIRAGGLVNQKARNIKDFLIWLKNERGALNLDFLCGMDASAAIEMLCQRRGIGIKTVSVTLMFACGKDIFPVDTHVHRIARRLGLIPQTCTAERAHELIPPLIPRGKALSFHVNLLEFGRKICRSRNPDCNVCPLRRSCLYVRGEVSA